MDPGTLLENKVERKVLPMTRVAREVQPLGPMRSRCKTPWNNSQHQNTPWNDFSHRRNPCPDSQTPNSFHDPQRPDTFHQSQAALEGYSAIIHNHDTHAPKTGRWNLAGHDDQDKAHNIVAEDEWNNSNANQVLIGIHGKFNTGKKI